MKPEKKSLKDLSSKTRFNTVKVTVIEKHRPQQYPGKNRFQRLLLKDENDTTMRACIYSEDIDNFADIINRGCDYEISNAFINSTNQMTITSRTHVRPLLLASGVVVPANNYRLLSSIPADPYSSESYDLIGVVLDVGPVKLVNVGRDNPVDVCDLIVTDDSIDDILIVSVWHDLVGTECRDLAMKAAAFPIVSFTCLTPSSYQGFSLGTTKCTFMTESPTGDHASALATWRDANTFVVSQRRLASVISKPVALPAKAASIEQVLSKTRDTTSRGEVMRVRVYIPDFSVHNISVFTGCGNCGKKTKQPNETEISCPFCNRTARVTPKLFFNFDGTDGTATLRLLAYKEQAEKLLQISADALLCFHAEEMEAFCSETAHRFRSDPVSIDIAPVIPRMEAMKNLKWVLKDVHVAVEKGSSSSDDRNIAAPLNKTVGTSVSKSTASTAVKHVAPTTRKHVTGPVSNTASAPVGKNNAAAAVKDNANSNA